MLHPDYSKLAARIAITSLHKSTSDKFIEVSQTLRNYKDKQGRPAPLLAEEVYEVIVKNIDKIQARLDYGRDFSYDFFGFKTLEKSYLLRADGQVVERP